MAPIKTLFTAAAFAVTLSAAAHAEEQKLETAIFAGGCFWCVESDFDQVPGVVETVSGYTGGELDDPTYGQVSAGGTGHLEAVQVTYDASAVTYEELLHFYWRSVDPTDAGGQFCDRSASYTTAIFAASDEQFAEAEKSKEELIASAVLRDPIVTPVRHASAFYPAEGYHQNYYQTHPYRYRLYRFSCGRDDRVKSLWGDEAWGGHGHKGS
jgi:peptide-methionine (S)-S-oxide reductase